MKKFNIYRNHLTILPVFLIFLTGIILNFTSCDKEEDYGIPVITNIRLPDPEKADSSITGGDLGQVIVIQGNNLASVQEIYFNSEKAEFIPTLATNTNIIVRIPSNFPVEITNTIRLVTLGGDVTYNFTVDIPSPAIDGIKSEYVADGGEAVIYGQYFYNVQSVTFPGNLEGTIIEYDPEVIKVKVPTGAQTGKITVSASAGTGESDFIFRDTTRLILDFDSAPICYGAMPIIDASTNPDPTPVSGNYARAQYDDLAGGSWWTEALVFAYCGSLRLTTGLPEDYEIKFEINILEEWTQGWFEVKVVGDIEYFYRFNPWVGTEGGTIITDGWVTMSIPLEEFREKTGSGNPDGIYLTDVTLLDELYFAFQNNLAAAINRLDVCFDNIRVYSATR